MQEPRNLEAVKAVSDPAERVRAASAYLLRLQRFQREAMDVRDDAVRKLPGGPTSIAAQTGLTIHLVKWIRKGSR